MAEKGLNVLETAVEGVVQAAGLAVHKALEQIPGTAEHAVARDLKQMQQEEQTTRGVPQHVRFQEGVKHPDETKPSKLARTPTPMVIQVAKEGQKSFPPVEDLEFTQPDGVVLEPSNEPYIAPADMMRTAEDLEFTQPDGVVLKPSNEPYIAPADMMRTAEDLEFTQPDGVVLGPSSEPYIAPADMMRTADDIDFVKSQPAAPEEVEKSSFFDLFRPHGALG